MDSKTCFKCKQPKPLEDFYKHPGMADGRLGKCKECNKQDVRENYALRRTQYQDYEAKRNKGVKRKDEILAASARHRENNPEKYKARTAVNNAVRDKRLIPEPCRVCGEKAQAHHEDYSKPLDVMWFCFKHHREHHGQHPRGSF
jgi:hypothetical protein